MGLIWILLSIVVYWLFFFFMRLGILAALAVGLLFVAVGGWFARRRGEELALSWLPALESRPRTHLEARLFGFEPGENPFLKVRVDPCNRGLLVAITVLFVGGIVALLAAPITIFERADRVSEEDWVFLVSVLVLCIFPLQVAVRWMAECWYVRFALVTIGFVTSRKVISIGSEVGYEFHDEEGQFFGGTSSEVRPIGPDNCVLVFAADFYPDINRPSCWFQFYRFSLVERGVILASQ